MTLIKHQRSRINAALQSILRAALGRDITPDELATRTAYYLTGTLIRGLGPTDRTSGARPLFLASDYSPSSPNDPLGGSDGRDISRAWAAVREDLDTVGEALSEAERKLNQALTLLRGQATLLSSDLQGTLLSAEALQSQSQQLFFGGSSGSAGRGSLVWSVDSDALVYPETTGVLMPGGIGTLPNYGQAAQPGSQDSGATIVALKITDSSDTSMLSNDSTRAWVESPFTDNNAAWSFTCTSANPATVTIESSGSSNISAFQLEVSEGITLTQVSQKSTGSILSYSTITGGGNLWVVLSSALDPSTEVTFSFSGVASTAASGNLQGSISALKAYIFNFESECAFVWGPFESEANNPDALYTITLDQIVSATPTGAGVDWQISTLSPDGPWVSVPTPGTPLLISASGREELDLLPSMCQPDANTLGYYYYNLSSVGSLEGGIFTAGQEQAKVDAYSYDWATQNDPTHVITDADWTTPPGVVRTVAMGAASNVFQGDQLTQNFPSSTYSQEGTALSRYLDVNGADLVYITLKGDDSNWTLSPGYNYRFTFSLWAPNSAYLPNMPVGVFNPNGDPGVLGVDVLVKLNGDTVYHGNTTFSNYQEVSSAPTSYGLTANQSSTWPPFCGRMTLNLVPGWNTLVVETWVPLNNAALSNNLQPWAGIVFGPSILADPTTRYYQTAIQKVQGWTDTWTQEDEFDLRTNLPIGMQDVWAWIVDPSTQNINGILLNHNPSASETGFSSLDNVFTGQARNHHISFLTQDNATTQTLAAGQDPLSTKVWVRARLSTPTATVGPFLSTFTLSVNQ